MMPVKSHALNQFGRRIRSLWIVFSLISLSACLGPWGSTNASPSLQETRIALSISQTALAISQAEAPPPPADVPPPTTDVTADREAALKATEQALQATMTAQTFNATVQALEATQAAMAAQLTGAAQPTLVPQPVQATPADTTLLNPLSGNLSLTVTPAPTGGTEVANLPPPKIKNIQFRGCKYQQKSKPSWRASRDDTNEVPPSKSEKDRVTLTWEPPQNSTDIDTYFYEIERNSNPVELKSGNTPDTYVVVELNCAYKYKWHVRIVYKSGAVGPFSSYQEFFLASN